MFSDKQSVWILNRGRLRRQASVFVAKLKKAPSTQKKNEFNSKTFTLSVLVRELVNVCELQAK